MDNQIKFSTCTLLASALTWWNSDVRIVGQDVAYAMTWTDLRKKITDKYCSRNEMKKHEKIPEVSTRLKECREGFKLPDMMLGKEVVASKLKTMQEATEMASKLMDKKINTIAERQAENKGKSSASVNPGSNQRGNGTGQGPTCFECGVQGHFKTDCPKLKNNNNNNNRGNQVSNANAPAKVYAVGHAGIKPDSNVVMGTFLLNNRYASILCDTGADRSFVSTAFSSQIDITPSTLDHYYDCKTSQRKMNCVNTIHYS
ncbi:putative reverse transcriptase domain-containing protein [Tanacetum coccineum]